MASKNKGFFKKVAEPATAAVPGEADQPVSAPLEPTQPAPAPAQPIQAIEREPEPTEPNLESSESTEADAPLGEGRRQRYLDGHSNALAKVLKGEFIHKTQRIVDPARCRMWERHNRRYQQLNEINCADVIDGLRAQGKQEFPAIVRKLEGDPNFDYEVICGKRRHWGVTYLRSQHYAIGFLIELRDLTDEEAFRLADIENRDRADICDYDRAMDYREALNLYYRSQAEMALRMEVTETWLSRFLELAELPPEIVSAYADVTHIRENHARQLKPLLKDAKTRKAVLAFAQELTDQQKAADAKSKLDGPAVLKALVESGKTKAAKATKAPSEKGVLHVYQAAASKKPALEVKRQGRSGLTLRIVPDSGATAGEILEHCQAALKAYLS